MEEGIPIGAQVGHLFELRKGYPAAIKPCKRFNMAMVQNQWYHFGIGAPPF